MVYATKERIVAARHFSSERYIRSTHPLLYISGRRDFQGTNTFLSDDAYGRLCTRTGALWRPQGYDFDGSDDKIDIPDSVDLDFTKTTPFSVVGWVKPPVGAVNGAWIGKANPSALKYWFSTIYPPGAGQLYLLLQYGGADAPDDGYKYVYGSTNMFENTWYGVAFTLDGSNTLAGIKLYVNGLLETNTTAESGTIGDITNTATLKIGMRCDTAGQLPFKGVIGDVLVYNRVLGAGEIQQIYQATKFRYQ